MEKINVIFLGSKKIGFDCLKFLIENSENSNLVINAVLSNNKKNDNNNLKKLAIDNKIKYLDELDEILSFKNIDFIISVQYHLILKKSHIDVARVLAINLHMAPLPEFRGCNQFTFAILNKCKIFGTTLHQLNEGIDAGPIIAEKRFDIPENCFVEELFKITETHSLILFKENIFDILIGKFKLLDQSILINERGTSIHYRNEINKVKIIDLNDSIDCIYTKIKATSFPGFEYPYTIINGEKIYLIHEKYKTQ